VSTSDCSFNSDVWYGCVCICQQVIAPTDCGSSAAIWFFPGVLVLTNYVMLNLFVGMIMNNFAYISAKDGNGAVEDEHFVDAAYKYVLHFDPKLKGQIPLEKVSTSLKLSLHVGTRKTANCPWGWDCVWVVDGSFLVDEPFARDALRPACASQLYTLMYIRTHTRSYAITYTYANAVVNNQVYHLFNIIGAPLGNYGTTQNVGRYLCIREELKRNLKNAEEVEPSWWWENVYFPTYEKNEQLIAENNADWKRIKSEVVRAEKELREVCTDDDDHILTGVGLVPDEREDNDMVKMKANEVGDEDAEEDDGNDEDDADAAPGKDGLIGKNKKVSIAGGNMGQPNKPAARTKKIKKNDKKKAMRAIERQLAEGADQDKLAQSMEEHKELLDIRAAKYKAALSVANNLPEPKPNMKMRYYYFKTWILSLFLPKREYNLRKPGHVFYDEIILAMLYW
jgi:hypothetical protein